MDADEVIRLARRLEDECPGWVLLAMGHTGFRDVIETIHTLSPDAYQALVRDLITN